MTGLIPADVIAEVRERTDIVQVIGQHVQLKRSGLNHKGLCPFHNEKTPSFNVNSQRQFYHCFGCHQSGDVFSFLMKIEGRSFSEVVEDLAARAGVEIPRQRVSPAQVRAAERRRTERQQGLDLNRKVADLYRELLQGPDGGPCRAYLEQRGISPQVAETFLLGYAPPSGSVVTRMLESSTVSMEFAERLGLVARRGRRDRGYHDRFWNRLIFPVIGASQEVLGFGGRMLGEGEGPKYINTPETILYRKGAILFGLAAAAKPMRQGVAYVVEGNLDVLQLHQHGFDSTVAPMGTALTEQQARLLKRFTQEVVAIFDGDEAGQAAALKAVPVLVGGGVQAKIATLPQGHDPDSFLRQEGAEAFGRIIQKARPAVEYMIDTLRSRMEATIPGRARVLEEVAPVVARLQSSTERELYAGRLALDLGIDPRVVVRAIRGERPRQMGRSRPRQAPERRQGLGIPQTELNVLGILLEHPHLVGRAEAAGLSEFLTNDGVRATYRAAVHMQQSCGEIDAVELLDSAPDDVRDAVAGIAMSGSFASVDNPLRALEDCLSDLKRRQLEQQREQILDQMARARSEGDTESERTLALRKIEVEREIHETR